MNNQGTGGFQQLFDWAAKLAYLNIIWIMYSLIGFVLLGVGPATVSLFTIVRHRLRGDDHYSIWKKFHQTYRQEFWKANKLMIPVYLIGGFIYLDFVFIQVLPYSFLIDYIVFPALLLLTMLFVAVVAYLFAVYVHFELPYGVNLQYALVMTGLYPLSSILLLAGLLIFAGIMFIFPAVIPFYGVSIPVLIIVSCTNRAFTAFIQTKNMQNTKAAIDKNNNPV